MAGPTSHEVFVHQDVLLQELPQHRQDQQLHQLPELLPTKGTLYKRIKAADACWLKVPQICLGLILQLEGTASGASFIISKRI